MSLTQQGVSCAGIRLLLGVALRSRSRAAVNSLFLLLLSLVWRGRRRPCVGGEIISGLAARQGAFVCVRVSVCTCVCVSRVCTRGRFVSVSQFLPKGYHAWTSRKDHGANRPCQSLVPPYPHLIIDPRIVKRPPFRCCVCATAR